MVRINPRWVLLLLLAADTALLVLFLLGEAGRIPIWTLQRLTLMNAEGDLPTWLASAQLLLVGVLLLIRAAALRSENIPGASHWLLLALAGLGFVMLSIDEATAMHESVTMTLHWHNVPPWGFFAQPHQGEIITLAIYGVAGLLLLAWRRRDVPALLREPYIPTLALGLSIIILGGMFIDTLWPRDILPKSIGDAIEEYLELTGGSILLYAALQAVHGVRLHVAPATIIPQRGGTVSEGEERAEVDRAGLGQTSARSTSPPSRNPASAFRHSNFEH